MKTIIYSLISAFIVWIVTQVTSISIVLGILIFVVSISILVSINFFINWIQAQKENNNLKTTINQTKSENEQLLKEIKQLRDEIDQLHQNQTALYNTIDDKNESIKTISHRADSLGNVIGILISKDETEKLAPLADSLLKLGEYNHEK
ncbi:hypothetical protein [Leuconostoc sp. UCMA20149]|uniref:hypothetical protein n=1 Tax=Leuconostoc sp. UCMA20149 TaxID=2583528 RepID=UPI0025B0A838|nr:hypothetical protein [Leuconostoc sp. UCMA20149]MDN2450216.1 hypothetical protein [Leuconostoc sp. UCMA20149]